MIFSIGKVSQIDDNFVQGGYKKHLGRNYLQQSILSLKRVKTMQLVSQSFFFFFVQNHKPLLSLNSIQPNAINFVF